MASKTPNTSTNHDGPSHKRAPVLSPKPGRIFRIKSVSVRNHSEASTENITDAIQCPTGLAIDQLDLTTTALTEFTLFPKLPSEIRIRIWHFSAPHPERFVTFKAGVFPLPALSQTNREARYEARSHIWGLQLGEVGISVNASNHASNILYIDTHILPHSFNHRISVFHTLLAVPKTVFDKDLLKCFTRISITPRELIRIWVDECLHCYIKENFLKLLPNLKEMNVLLRSGPRGAVPEDMWVIEQGEVKNQVEHHRHTIRDLKSIWKRVVDDDDSDVRFKEIALRFVRVERWEK